MPAFAQIPAGTSTIGGSFSLHHTSYKYPDNRDQTTNDFSLQPSYGYFLIDNLCLGAAIGLSTSSSTAETNVTAVDRKSKSNAVGIGPFARYYVPLDDKLYVFGQLSYSRNWEKYQSWNSNQANNKSTQKYVYYDLGIAAGIAYFLNPHVSLDLALGYVHTKDSDRDPSVENYKANRIGLDAGIRVFLRKD